MRLRCPKVRMLAVLLMSPILFIASRLQRYCPYFVDVTVSGDVEKNPGPVQQELCEWCEEEPNYERVSLVACLFVTCVLFFYFKLFTYKGPKRPKWWENREPEPDWADKFRERLTGLISSITSFVRDLTRDGDVEPNPGPVNLLTQRIFNWTLTWPPVIASILHHCSDRRHDPAVLLEFMYSLYVIGCYVAIWCWIISNICSKLRGRKDLTRDGDVESNPGPFPSDLLHLLEHPRLSYETRVVVEDIHHEVGILVPGSLNGLEYAFIAMALFPLSLVNPALASVLLPLLCILFKLIISNDVLADRVIVRSTVEEGDDIAYVGDEDKLAAMEPIAILFFSIVSAVGVIRSLGGFIADLTRCGDVEANPGPPNKGTKKVSPRQPPPQNKRRGRMPPPDDEPYENPRERNRQENTSKPREKFNRPHQFQCCQALLEEGRCSSCRVSMSLRDKIDVLESYLKAQGIVNPYNVTDPLILSRLLSIIRRYSETVYHNFVEHLPLRLEVEPCEEEIVFGERIFIRTRECKTAPVPEKPPSVTDQMTDELKLRQTRVKLETTPTTNTYRGYGIVTGVTEDLRLKTHGALNPPDSSIHTRIEMKDIHEVLVTDEVRQWFAMRFKRDKLEKRHGGSLIKFLVFCFLPFAVFPFVMWLLDFDILNSWFWCCFFIQCFILYKAPKIAKFIFECCTNPRVNLMPKQKFKRYWHGAWAENDHVVIPVPSYTCRDVTNLNPNQVKEQAKRPIFSIYRRSIRLRRMTQYGEYKYVWPSTNPLYLLLFVLYRLYMCIKRPYIIKIEGNSQLDVVNDPNSPLDRLSNIPAPQRVIQHPANLTTAQVMMFTPSVSKGSTDLVFYCPQILFDRFQPSMLSLTDQQMQAAYSNMVYNNALHSFPQRWHIYVRAGWQILLALKNTSAIEPIKSDFQSTLPPIQPYTVTMNSSRTLGPWLRACP